MISKILIYFILLYEMIYLFHIDHSYIYKALSKKVTFK